jgi:hypothetical protein
MISSWRNSIIWGQQTRHRSPWRTDRQDQMIYIDPPLQPARSTPRLRIETESAKWLPLEGRVYRISGAKGLNPICR